MAATAATTESPSPIKKDWKLYQFYESPFCNKIRRVLAYKGLLTRVEIVEVSMGSSLKSLHHQGKLPIMEFEDGTRVCDSTDIALAIEKRYPEPSLYPLESRDQALCHIIEDWADESLYFHEMRLRFIHGKNRAKWGPELLKHTGAFLRLSIGLMLPTFLESILDKQGLGRRNDAEFLQNIEKHVSAAAKLLEGQQQQQQQDEEERRWLLGGEKLTIADISVFSQLHCFAGTPEGLREMEKYPKLMKWMERVRETTEPEQQGVSI